MSGKIWRDLFYSLAGILIAIFVYLVLSGKDGQFLMLVAAFISLVASRFDDLVKFKVSTGGLEGEMREAIEEARATVAQLHLLALQQSRLILWSMQAGQRWSGLNLESQEEMRQSVISTLKNLDVTQDKIDEVVSVEFPYIAFDYSQFVTKGLGNHLEGERRSKWNDFFSSDKRKGIGFEPTPDELEAFLNSLNLVDDEVKARLADYRYFLKAHKHRRPEVWMTSRS